MLKDDVLGFLSQILVKDLVRISEVDKEVFFSNIDAYTDNQIENIGFASFVETETIITFFRKIYQMQISEIKSLQALFNKVSGVFIQGFCRNMDFEPVLPLSKRADIDVYVPKENYPYFLEKLQLSGYKHLGFNEAGFIELNELSVKAFAADYWAEKDMTLTRPIYIGRHEDAPIDVKDFYLPIINIEGELFLLISFEPHFSYLDYSERSVFASLSEQWVMTGCSRITVVGAIFFNIIRLDMGVQRRENRVRIILEIAALLHLDELNNFDFAGLENLILSHPARSKISAMAIVLAQLHPAFQLFARLEKFACPDHVKILSSSLEAIFSKRVVMGA
ncbi:MULTISPECIES: hypothetical protein [unclassified Pseudomonas]|uniref:hypothetical protein n=1 Tax=unclassified Pseudomonas TaxID=196821 RepID=UPI00131C5485|nr:MULTISPECIES: hypothetical protein [unclassified Pseudomonas]